MMVLSVGRRFIADALNQNMSTGNRSGDGKAVVTNLRLVYTFTMGRLSWELEDLSRTFHADCNASTSSNCRGIHVPLSNTSLGGESSLTEASSKNQHLVVSAEALPTDLILPSTHLYAFKPRGISLVEVAQLGQFVQRSTYEISYGDVLLPHNAGTVNWAMDQVVGPNCDSDVDTHISTRISNHFYIEHSYQVAYTAATFFLLQGGVVKDVVELSDKTTTLSFDQNTQDVLVWVSTPLQNVLLTVAGCLLLLVSLIAAAGLSMSSTEYPLAAITAPQAIARVMLDEAQFPAPFLRRRVVNSTREGPDAKDNLSQFAITEIAVDHKDGDEHFVAVQ